MLKLNHIQPFIPHFIMKNDTLMILRKKITSIDKQIIDLLDKRNENIVKIGQFKKKHQLTIKNKQREAILLDELKQYAQQYNINEKTIDELFEIIIQNSIELQHNIINT